MAEVMSLPTTSMMSSSDAVISSFTAYIRGLESETKGLKSLFNLSSALESGSSLELQDLVNDIESIVSRMELSVDIFDSAMSQESAKLDQTLTLLSAAKQQQAHIKELESLNSVNTCSKLDADINNRSITEEEFLNVSKITRNRTTVAQINEAMDWLTKYITEKAKILSKTSKGGLSKQAQKVKDHYLSLSCSDHGNHMFAIESELRNTLIFRSGDARYI